MFLNPPLSVLLDIFGIEVANLFSTITQNYNENANCGRAYDQLKILKDAAAWHEGNHP